jgi:hypothetical protein
VRAIDRFIPPDLTSRRLRATGASAVLQKSYRQMLPLAQQVEGVAAVIDEVDAGAALVRASAKKESGQRGPAVSSIW